MHTRLYIYINTYILLVSNPFKINKTYIEKFLLPYNYIQTCWSTHPYQVTNQEKFQGFLLWNSTILENY